MISETCLSQFALPFYVEQLRIEKYYLGYHPYLASVLISIGQVYERKDKLIEAKKHFMEALSLMNGHNIKGRLHASLMFNIELVDYRQSSYLEAMKNSL